MARHRFVAESTPDGALDRWEPEATAVPWSGEAPPVGSWLEVDVADGRATPGRELAPAGSALARLVAIAAKEGLDPVFEDAVLGELDALGVAEEPPRGVHDEDLVDLTDVAFVTIDNEDSRDLDQAVHVGTDGDGHRVRYALADASYYVAPGTALFDDALRRTASFYFPGWMIPMLPRALSEGAVSLNEDVLRRALVFDMRVDANGKCTGTEIVRARIRSRAKLSYDGVQRFLDMPDAHPIADAEVADSLRALAVVGQRRIDEASTRDVVHHRRRTVELGLSGVRSFVIYGGMRNDVERYNEQISLLCNVEGARLLHQTEASPDVQPVYRVHPSPPSDRVTQLEKMVERVAALHTQDADQFRWRRAEGQCLSSYLDALPLEGEASRVSQAIHRQAILMNVRSTFSDQAAGHHGVGADVYARFSSPMREVVGVFLHKELLEALGAGDAPLDPDRDRALRERVIEAANHAKSMQRKITALANRLAIDELFERDSAMPREERPVRRGTIMGVTHAKLHLALDEPPIDVKLYRRDLESARGAKIRLGEDDVTWRTTGGETIARVGDAASVRLSHRDEKRDRWVLHLIED